MMSKTLKDLFIFTVFLMSVEVYGQHRFSAKITDATTNLPLVGVSMYVPILKKGSVSDAEGRISLSGISTGSYALVFTHVGYRKTNQTFRFPLSDTLLLIQMEAEVEALEDIVISADRTNSRIEDVPTKIEVVALDEIEEMTGIRPTNVSLLLTEASGVQQQITSPTSGNVNARIYGLDGQYTQIVKDGFPMFSGYSSGFSIMQIPPLDLRQIEIIKGAASALYGGDAIGGVMNLVSKAPQQERELTILLNQTQKKGTDLNAYYAKRNDHVGFSLLATQSFQQAVDVNNDHFSDLPRVRLTNIQPKFYYYFDSKTTLSLFLNATFDRRKGGDMEAVAQQPTAQHPYIDDNQSQRLFSQLKFEKQYPNRNSLVFKNGLGYFDRTIRTGNFSFGGSQVHSYSELSYLMNFKHNKVVVGGNFNTDDFSERNASTNNTRSYRYQTAGLFAQDDWAISSSFTAQLGLRLDHQNKFGTFVLPRLSLMYKINDKFTARVGSGLGYKAPTVFSAGYDQDAFYNVRRLNVANTRAEQSVGINGDVNYKNRFGVLTLNANQAFFFTQIQHTITPQVDSLWRGVFYFVNANEPFQTAGTETNLRLGWGDWSLHAAYTYTRAEKRFAEGIKEAPFVARHRVVLDAFVYIKEVWNVGIEGFYTSRQYIGEGEYGRGYWNLALMISRKIKDITLLLNVENLTDRRQTRWEQVVQGSEQNPHFRPIYAPLDGIVINFSVRSRVW